MSTSLLRKTREAIVVPGVIDESVVNTVPFNMTSQVE